MILKKRKIFYYLICYFIFFNLWSYEDKILLKINNEIITSYDLKNKILTTLILSQEEINQENINKTRPLVLKNLIDLKIKENELKKFNIKVTEQELSDRLNIIANGKLNAFEKNFQLYNLNYEIFKDDLKTELAWRKLVYFLFNKKVEVSDSEIELQLKKIINSNEGGNINYRLSELVVNFSDLEEKNEKIKEINQYINTIGFEKTLLKFNESISQDNKGDLGWINSKALSKNILNAIRDLKLNEISKPIIIGNSMLILKVVDKKETKLNEKNIENIKKEILERKKNQLFNLYSNSHLSKLKNLSSIEYQ